MTDNEKTACDRCTYACELLDKENIPYEVKKKEIGHINLLFEGKVVMSFWARTGRFIYTVNPNNYNVQPLDSDLDRGIKNCIKAYISTLNNGSELKDCHSNIWIIEGDEIVCYKWKTWLPFEGKPTETRIKITDDMYCKITDKNIAISNRKRI